MFVDQSYWQTAVAARPGHGVWGFITAGLAWFSIPLAMSLTLGMGYWVFSVQVGEQIITDQHVLDGK